MRSGISNYKTVFCKTMARFWPIWASWLLIWLLLMPLSVLMDQRYGTAMVRVDFLDALETGTEMDLLVIAFAAFAAMAVLSPLYKTRSANFMGSLPMRREGLFCTYYLAGFCFGALPAVLVSLIMAIIGLVVNVGAMAPVGLWLLICVGKYFFFYSFAIFCGMFAGHILALPAYYGIFNVLAYSLYMLLDDVFRTFYYGYTSMGSTVQNVVELLTPIQILPNVRLRINYIMDNHMPTQITPDFTGGIALLIYGIVAVVFTVVALLLFRKRRLESAEDVVAVNPMKPVFRYSVAFCAGLFFGYITNMMLDGNTVSWMVCTILWAVFGSFAAQMILDKSFKVFRKWKGAAAVAGVFVLMYVVIAFDLTGFETRIPDVNDVESVSLVNFYSDSGMLDLYRGIEVTDPDRIQDIITLHKSALDQRNDDVDDYDSYRYDNTSMRIAYKLKNGSVFERRYSFRVDPAEVGQEGTGAYALQRMVLDKDLMWHALGLNLLDERTVSSIEYSNNYVTQGEHASAEPAGTVVQTEADYFGNHDAMIFYGKDADRIIEAIREDFANGLFYRTTVKDPTDGEYDAAYGPYGRGLRFYFQNDAEEDQRIYDNSLYVKIPSTAAATNAVLDELIDEVLANQ